MIYKDYSKAAQRHRETCEYLLLKLRDRHETIDTHKQKKLLQNIYYLSGYVIECIISYSFFHVIGYDLTKSVYDLDVNNPYSYTFYKFFNEHSNKANELRVEEIRKRGGNISSETPIIGDVNVDETEQKMYEEWNATARYSIAHLSFDFNYKNISSFYNLANSIYTKMRRI